MSVPNEFIQGNIITTRSSIPRSSLPQIVLVAPSARVAAFLARKGRLGKPYLARDQTPRSYLTEPTGTMALQTVENPYLGRLEPTPPPAAPPAVAITPCDPWPRPYYLEDGLRRVAPYHFTYNTNCKQRWRGREILEIFRDEFRDRPEEYYVCLDQET